MTAPGNRRRSRALPAEAFWHAAEGGVVSVPGEVCAWLHDHAGLDRLRVRVRGADPLVDNVLLAMRAAAVSFRAANGTAPAAVTSMSADLGTVADTSDADRGDWHTTREVAAVTGLTERGVRAAIKRGQLPAERFGNGPWRITGAAVTAFTRVRSKGDTA